MDHQVAELKPKAPELVELIEIPRVGRAGKKPKGAVLRDRRDLNAATTEASKP